LNDLLKGGVKTSAMETVRFGRIMPALLVSAVMFGGGAANHEQIHSTSSLGTAGAKVEILPRQKSYRPSWQKEFLRRPFSSFIRVRI
jgi:hypothetical protein